MSNWIKRIAQAVVTKIKNVFTRRIIVIGKVIYSKRPAPLTFRATRISTEKAQAFGQLPLF